MQNEDGAKLRKAWEKKGNPPCEHTSLDKEYYLGSQTGDFVCMTCGETWFSGDPNRPDSNR